MVDISYLQALSKVRTSSFISDYLLNFAIDVALIVSLCLSIETLKLVALYVSLIATIIMFFGSLYVKELLIARVEEKEFGTLFGFVRSFTYRQKYSTFLSVYSFISLGITLTAMCSIGWIWQAVVFVILTFSIGSFLKDFYSQLPKTIEQLNIAVDEI